VGFAKSVSAPVDPRTPCTSNDCVVTLRMKQSLALVEVRVLDHFIVGDGAPTSMAQRGML